MMNMFEFRTGFRKLLGGNTNLEREINRVRALELSYCYCTASDRKRLAASMELRRDLAKIK